MADGPAVEILADAGYQGLGAQTGGRVAIPPHCKFKKNPRTGTRRCTSASAERTLRVRFGHGIAPLKNWRALARHLGRREHTSDTVQAIASLLSHLQPADLTRHGRDELRSH
ncbi:hypothetical protein GCM10023097_77520 [Streptomyces collinus]